MARDHRRSPLQQLRTAIDCLPRHTREAMLDGVRGNDIIVGAYADRRGGICPMLAAHRCGGRTDFISFARAWDRFAGAPRTRRATERELLILTTHLEASLLAEETPDSELAAAIADHRRLAARPTPRTARPGDPDRSKELGKRAGWSWLRPFRRYDDYRRALARLEAAETELRPDRELTPA
jgi:hypothetical protein